MRKCMSILNCFCFWMNVGPQSCSHQRERASSVSFICCGLCSSDWFSPFILLIFLLSNRAAIYWFVHIPIYDILHSYLPVEFQTCAFYLITLHWCSLYYHHNHFILKHKVQIWTNVLSFGRKIEFLTLSSFTEYDYRFGSKHLNSGVVLSN